MNQESRPVDGLYRHFENAVLVHPSEVRRPSDLPIQDLPVAWERSLGANAIAIPLTPLDFRRSFDENTVDQKRASS